MAYQIRISPNALRASAERALTVTAAVDDATAVISQLVTELNAAWDGGASQQALEDLRRIRENIADIGQGTNGTAQKLKEVAEVFEKLDDAIAGPVAVPMHPQIINMVGAIMKKPIWIDQLNWFVANTLRIVPDEVRQVSVKCRQVSDELQGTAMQLSEMVDNLAGEWEGKSYNRFASDTKEMVAGFKRSAESLEAFANTIAKAADRYEALDNSLA